MQICKIEGKKLNILKEDSFQKEKEIHELISDETNLKSIFGLERIKNEFPVENRSIDTLCFDPEKKSFVIIEFKKEKNISVFDQGMTYLSLMLNNKAEFVLEYNKIKNKSLGKNDIDWSQSKVMIFSPHFTDFQKGSINFKDIPIELWEFQKFGNILALDQIKTASTESLKTLKLGNKYEPVSKEIQPYDIDYHLKGNDNLRDLFLTLQEKILDLGDDVKEYVGKSSIYYKRNGLTFIYIWFVSQIMKGELRITKAEPIKDIIIIRDVEESNPFKVKLKIRKPEDIDTVFGVIRKAYEGV